MNTLLLALMSIVLSVMAQFFLKAGMSSTAVKGAMARPIGPDTFLTLCSNLYVLGGFFLYGLGAVIWLSVLSKWDVSKAYPLVGVGFALTAEIGLFAGEQVTLLRAGGVTLICLGVFVVAQS